MEERCFDAANSIALNLTHTSSCTSSIASTASQVDLIDTQETNPTCSSMSLLREDSSNSQHEYAEVLDDETTTSGVLETFEISSSNSLPTCSDAEANAGMAVAVDDSSSTDTIKLISVSNPALCHNNFFNTSEVYVINDDDDDDDDDDDQAFEEADIEDMLEDEKTVAEQQTTHVNATETTSSEIEQLNGVIMTSGGSTIYIETPVVEEQQHHPQIINLSGQVEYTEKVGNPKRLSDEFLIGEDVDVDALLYVEDDDDDIEADSGEREDKAICEENAKSISFCKSTAPPKEANEAMRNKADACAATTTEGHVEFRLKKMNINNTGANDANRLPSTTNAMHFACDLPCSSQQTAAVAIAPTMADIESMDLIERRDFETEQRLTGGIILKSSSLVSKHMLNLSLIKSCAPQQQQQNTSLSQLPQDIISDDNCPSSSSGGASSSNATDARVVSSDSKCNYKDPSTTPTSSRTNNSRLTKSTTKMNLCTTLSQQQQQLQQQPKSNAYAPTSSSSSTCSTSFTSTTSSSASAFNKSSSGSVIVEALITAPAAVEIFSNSNSNDSFGVSGNGGTTMQATQVPACEQRKQPQHESAFDHESGCSRTIALRSTSECSSTVTVSAAASTVAALDDALPSTSSARCQYAPKALRQVHASAQTNERFLSRIGSMAATAGTGTGLSGNNMMAAATSGGSSGGINLSRNRRRTEPSTAQLAQNSNSEEVIAAYRVAVAEAAAAAAAVAAVAERGDFNEDTWADCEENNCSDQEEVCTCQHSSSGSSHGGSSTSLNETDDAESLSINCSKDADLSNYIQMVSISEHGVGLSPDSALAAASAGGHTQRKRKYTETRLFDSTDGCTVSTISSDSRKRIAYDCASTPRSSQNACNPMLQCGMSATTTTTTPNSITQLALSSFSGSPLSRRTTPRSVIPTRENPPPELQNWLTQFQRWSHAERLLAVDRLIEHCEPTQVRHMMKVIEPQFQRDFISLLPRELALQVLTYLEPKDLLRAAQTCRSWRFLCDDNLLWKEKCRKSQILTEPRSDRPKRGRAGNMPPIASPWKAAYMRQHIIEMNWRSRPIREPKVLKGHDDHVITCLQFSGNRIVSGSDDNTLKVWSAVTGRCLRTLVGHTGGVWSSQMSGNIIISGSTDRTLKVWDMETGQCVHTLLGHTSTVRCMHLHGNKVVSGSRDATLRVWDIDQGTCLHVLAGHLAAVRCVQYDGKLIVSGAYDYMVKIWHPERQECLHTLQGHTNRVYSLQFDGVYVVSGSLDTSIRVWDVETGNCKHTLMGHQSLTSGMELRSNILVSGNADSTVKVWDITTGQCLQTLSGPNKHQSAVTCLQFNSRFVVTSSDDGTVKLWDVKTGEFIRNLVALESGGSGGVVWRIRANDTKLICAVGSRNGTEETKLMVLDFDVEGACVKCS